MQKHQDNLASRINGNSLQPLSGVTVTVVNDATGLPAALYSDNGVTLITAPIITDDNGGYSFYAADGKYTVTFSGTRLSTPVTRKIILEDPDDNPAASLAQLAASGGGDLVSTVAEGSGAITRKIKSKLHDHVPTAFDFMTAAEIADVRAGTALVDVTAAVVTALASGPVVFNRGTYKITSGLTAVSNMLGDGTWPTLKFVLGATAPTTGGALIQVTGEADVSGIKIDPTGSTKVQYGIFIDASTRTVTRPTNYDVVFTGAVSNSDSTTGCAGVVFYTSSSATNLSQKAKIKARVKGVVATANGIVGDSAGAGSGILVSINGSGSDNDIEIVDSYVTGVRPIEDGDGIHIYVADHNVDTAKGVYRITRCKTGDNGKRGIKVQAQNCTITDPYVECDLVGSSASSLGIDCYGQNNVVINPIVLASYANDGICGRGDRFKLVNPIMRMLQPTVPIRIDSSIGFEVLGGSVYTEKNFTNNDSPIISLNVGCSGYIRAPHCVNTLSKGSIVQAQSLGENDLVVIDIPAAGTSETLVAARFCAAGSIVVNDVRGACAGFVIDASDCPEIRVNKVNATTTGSVGVWAQRSTLKMIGSGRITGMTGVGVSCNGVATGTGAQSIVGDWFFIGNAATGGVDITSSANSEVIGVYTEGFTNHIKYGSSTKAFIGNNRARGAGTHLLSTSATGTIAYNNNLIV